MPVVYYAALNESLSKARGASSGCPPDRGARRVAASRAEGALSEPFVGFACLLVGRGGESWHGPCRECYGTRWPRRSAT